MERAGHVTYAGDERCMQGFGVEIWKSQSKMGGQYKSRSSSRNAKFCYLNMGRHLCCLRSLVEIYLQTIDHKIILARGRERLARCG